MKAMILAAGVGSRLSPYTDKVPKPMIAIGQKPILQHIIEKLCQSHISQIAINLHYLPKVIKEYFGSGKNWGCDILYSFEDKLLGTAGALKPLSDFLDETFIVWYGDNLCQINLENLVDFHHRNKSMATIALHWRDDVTQSGVVQLDNKSKVQRFVEKPSMSNISSHWVNAGVYILEPEIIDYISNDQVCDFGRDLFPVLLEIGKPVYGYRMSQNEKIWWIDRVEDYENVLENW